MCQLCSCSFWSFPKTKVALGDMKVKKEEKQKPKFSFQLCTDEALGGGRFPCWVYPLQLVSWGWTRFGHWNYKGPTGEKTLVIPSHPWTLWVDGFPRAHDKDHKDFWNLAPKRVRADQVSITNIIFWIITPKVSNNSVACYWPKNPE